MNIDTGESTEFKSITPWSRPYDLAVDRLDDVWFSQLAVDKVGVVDGRTHEVTEVDLTPMKTPDLRPEDLEIAKRVGSWDWQAVLGQQGPRRMGADPTGDFVWVGLYWAGAIAKIDIRTKKLAAIYQVPNGRWVQPYKMMVDKNHIVWVPYIGAEKIARVQFRTNTAR